VGYDLAFWSDKRRLRPQPRKVYAKLVEGQRVRGLDNFAAAEVVAALSDRFPGMVTDGSGYGSYELPSGAGVFEFSWSAQHLVVSARGSVSDDEMNAVIDICVDIGGARLYDPQTDERFDSV